MAMKFKIFICCLIAGSGCLDLVSSGGSEGTGLLIVAAGVWVLSPTG